MKNFGFDTFTRLLAKIEPIIESYGYWVIEKRNYREFFGSQTVTFGNTRQLLRLSWDGKEQWIVGEAAPDFPHSSSWKVIIHSSMAQRDLTLENVDPIISDIINAIADHLDMSR
jgi:hypothetical protein